MSDLRKAAQQALEALETCVMAMQDYQSGIGITEMFDKGERMGREQIAVLRAALEEPTGKVNVIKTWNERCETHPDHQAGMVSNLMIQARMQEEIDELRAALAETVPSDCPPDSHQPVAWSFVARHIDTAFGPAVSLQHPGPEHKFMRNVKPLYAAPPQRKPLTEEEIGAAANSVRWSQQYHVDFTRAIERAHGITK